MLVGELAQEAVGELAREAVGELARETVGESVRAIDKLTREFERRTPARQCANQHLIGI